MSLLDNASLLLTPNAYKEGKLYSVIPSDGSGDMSVTRATTATRVNSAGLVELVPYNLFSYSEQFENTSNWPVQDSAVVTANTTTAPNGTTTADTISFGASPISGCFQGVTNGAGTFTFSIYAKCASGTQSFKFIMYNPTDNQIDSTIFTVTTEWQRFQYSFIVTQNSNWYIANANDGVIRSIFIWGAQLNEGTLKPYQKTETRLNIPRLDYSNGTCPSILVEPQRTNTLTYSSSFDNAAWEKQLGSSVTANTTTAPDGTMTADTLTIAPNQYMHQLQGLSSGTSYTISFYCKVASGTKQFNMHTYSPSGNINYSPTLTATTEWQRFEFTITANATASTSIYPVLVDSFASGSFFIWGAQMEVGAYATSYIPTATASVTRNADQCFKTGASSLIGQTEGTLFGEMYVNSSGENQLMLVRNGATGLYTDIIYLGTNAFGHGFVRVVKSGSIVCDILTASPLTKTWHKFAFAYKQNDFVLYIDGVNIGTDTSGNVPSGMNEIYLDQYIDGAIRNASKKSAALWKQRLTNTQLAQITAL